MSAIIEFIKIFQSPSNINLFTECACYWFANILHQRFPNSYIVYDPHQVHFATKIEDRVYDITGIVGEDSDYIDWEYYAFFHQEDAELIIRNCINLERR